jgi:DNA-binding protein Fis
MEFIMGIDFQHVLQHFGIKDVPTTSMHNPQSNKSCKQLHKSMVKNALHVYLSQAVPFNIGNIAELVDSTLETALHAACSMIHCTLGMMPGWRHHFPS